jgi:hypothetical protein
MFSDQYYINWIQSKWRPEYENKWRPEYQKQMPVAYRPLRGRHILGVITTRLSYVTESLMRVAEDTFGS